MRIILGDFNLEEVNVRKDWGRRDSSADLSFRGKGKHDQYRLELPCPAGWSPEKLLRWASERVARYEVFPTSRMKALVDSADGRVAPGATILQGVYIGPFRLRMADRVLDVFEGANQKEQWAGFTYGTLKGHAERGIETFRVTWDKASAQVTFSMEAWSEPGHWLVWLFYPWARWVQKKAGREAMGFMKKRLEAIQEGKKP
jgi:uncharacterized protein (UPF0548 family)